MNHTVGETADRSELFERLSALSKSSEAKEVISILSSLLEGYEGAAKLGSDPDADDRRALLGLQTLGPQHLSVFVLTGFTGAPDGIGPHYRRAQQFHLFDELRGQRLRKVTFDAGRRRLSVELYRTQRARQLDRGKAFQTLEIELSPEGAVQEVSLSTASRFERLLGRSFRARFRCQLPAMRGDSLFGRATAEAA